MAALAPERTLSVDPFDVSRPELYRDDTWQAPFRELRERAPVHLVEHSDYGPYWAISGYKPVVEVESLPDLFSSEAGGITLADFIPESDVRMPMFIAMDRPKHTAQRRTVAPAFTPSEMARMGADIRRRTADILDALPIGERFDWVDTVAIELTTQMLAILFDFPWDERRKLTFWSDWAGDIELVKTPELRRQRLAHMFECGAYFQNLWNQKIGREPTPDLISMMIHSDAMAEMDAHEFLGNLILLIVGGNDTTRNSMSAVAYGLDRFPDARARLEADPSLIANATQEIIRWQTPLAHMRRTATADTELMGQRIREGDKLALWYISANRDESVFGADADAVRVDRPNARRHLAFGHGIHRCVGAAGRAADRDAAGGDGQAALAGERGRRAGARRGVLRPRIPQAAGGGDAVLGGLWWTFPPIQLHLYHLHDQPPPVPDPFRHRRRRCRALEPRQRAGPRRRALSRHADRRAMEGEAAARCL